MELFPHCVVSLLRTHTYTPISDSKTSALCLWPVPWYTSPMPITAATCNRKRKKKTDEELNDHPGKIKRNLFGGATGRASSVKI